MMGLAGLGRLSWPSRTLSGINCGYSAVLWLDIRDAASAKQSFAVIAQRIWRYHPSASYISTADPSGNLDDLVNAVLAWLSEVGNTHWLAIYDNYDNPWGVGNSGANAVDIHRFLPDAWQGSVVVTTGSSQLKIGKRIPVRKLTSMQHSADILSNASRRRMSLSGESLSRRSCVYLTKS